MVGGSAIRGSKIGSGPMGESERGEMAPRLVVSFWCSQGHETAPSFAIGAEVPDTWDCPRCGCPAGREQNNPPAPLKTEPYKTHLAYVKERRTSEDAEALLAEALEAVRRDREF